MKHTIFFTLLSALMLVSCRKDDNPKIPDLTRVPTPLITKDTSTDQTISAQNPELFNAKFVVDLYFKEDVPPQKFDIVVVKNGDKTNVKTIKTDVTSFPTTIEITGNQLISLFGEPIVLDDQFDIGADITSANGQVFQAFPVVGEGYGSGVGNQQGASTSVRYTAVCKYDPSIYEGNFVVIEDEFQDLAPGDVVKLTRIDDTHFSYIYPSGINPTPIIVTVNPVTNAVSIAKQKFGSAFTWEPSYTNPHAETGNDLRNVVAPCAQEWGAAISYSVDQGNFGSYYIKMKKQ